jgi:hypothetical protein
VRGAGAGVVLVTGQHALDAILEAVILGLDRELQRQNGRLDDLPPVHGRGRARRDWTYSRREVVDAGTVTAEDQAEDGDAA